MLDKLISIAFKAVKYLGVYSLFGLLIRFLANSFIDCRMYEARRGSACFFGDVDVTLYDQIFTSSVFISIVLVFLISALSIPLIITEKLLSTGDKM
jgi:hypothetical protein